MKTFSETTGLCNMKGKRVFMIGIGGCSMSGLALLLKSRGHEVLGSSIIDSEYIQTLEANGIRVIPKDDPADIEGADLIIYSHAVSLQNVLISAAVHRGIPVQPIPRSRIIMLIYFSRQTAEKRKSKNWMRRNTLKYENIDWKC